jgi:hypothetical protein
VIVPPREITSTYTYTTCFAYAGIRRIISGEYVSWCAGYTDITVEVAPFRPHFYYNNMCGSTILQVYIPIYTYIYAMLLVFPPISLYLLARYVRYESLPSWLKPFVPAIIWPIQSEETIRDSLSSLDESGRTSGGKDLLSVSPMLFKRDNIAVSLMLHVALLLTFGLCSPILGFAIMTVTCLSMTQWRILIARFVSIRAQQSKALSTDPESSGAPTATTAVAPRRGSRPMKEDDVINVLSAMVGDTAACFQSMLWAVLWTSCLFFAFLCWDIAADTVGWVQSCWIPLVAFCALPLLKACVVLAERLYWPQTMADLWTTDSEARASSFQARDQNEAEEGREEGLGRSSEFAESNPLRVTSLEMVGTSLSVTQPSRALAAVVANLGDDFEEEEDSVRHTV